MEYRRETMRDREFIENRLLAPANDLSEILHRLTDLGHTRQAEYIMNILQRVTDECRHIRNELYHPEKIWP